MSESNAQYLARVRRDECLDAVFESARSVVEAYSSVECGCDDDEPECSVCMLALCLRTWDKLHGEEAE